MFQPLVSFEIPSTSQSADFNFDFGSFSTTTANVEAVSEKGKVMFAEMFGQGAVSAVLPKSKAADMEVFFQQRGFIVKAQ